MSKANQTEKSAKITSVAAKESDGNIQITFTIPFDFVQKAKTEAAKEMAGDVEVPGFRKGKAPLEKVREKVGENRITEHALSHILPKAFADSITEHKLKPAIYPKFELVKAGENEPWEIMAVTCELPEINLGDYKTAVKEALPGKKIIVPGKPEEKEISPEEKERIAIRTLLENIKFEIPKILVDEEVQGRLSNLLSRIEKLGLSLEGYLSSVGKNVETLRKEYEAQSRDAIKLDLILGRVAEAENVKVQEKEVEEALKIAQNTNPDGDPESRKRLIESILKRQLALAALTRLG